MFYHEVCLKRSSYYVSVFIVDYFDILFVVVERDLYPDNSSDSIFKVLAIIQNRIKVGLFVTTITPFVEFFENNVIRIIDASNSLILIICTSRLDNESTGSPPAELLPLHPTTDKMAKIAIDNFFISLLICLFIIIFTN